jgi:general secretion pathway protein A
MIHVDWSFFGLKETPFNVTPDPSYLYLTTAHEGALSSLVYGIGARKGFMMVSGEVGTGKTTLCRALMSQLDQSVHKALVFSSSLGRDELIRLIAADFGIPGNESGDVTQIEDLNRFLLERLARGENAVLIIDEAQNLPDATLEEIRLISNLETDRQKLIQIILVGQPELRDKLQQQHLRQLDQRIAVRYHLRPIVLSETREYVSHRIRVASVGDPPELFSPKAVRAIHSWSRGFPRLINVLCEHSLIEAYREKLKRAGLRHVRLAWKALQAEGPRKNREGLKWVALGAAAAMALWFAAKPFLSGERKPPPGGQIPPPLPTSVQSPGDTAATLAVASLKEPAPARDTDGIVRVGSADRTLNASMATLFHIWKMNYLAEESKGWKIVNVNSALLQVFFREMDISGQYGVEFRARPADLDAVRRLDLPSLFAYTEDPGGAGSRYAVLAGLKGEDAVVYDPLSGRRVVPAPVLLEEVEGPIYFLLKHAEEGLLREGGRGSEVMSLQEQLKDAGFFAGAPTGFYGSATSEAVRSLQREHDLEEDGVAGMETRILLARLAGRFIPSLSDPR